MEDEMLKCACPIYARQGKPFTVPIFAEEAITFADRDEEHPFSRLFVSDFVAHHRELSMDGGNNITDKNVGHNVSDDTKFHRPVQ